MKSLKKQGAHSILTISVFSIQFAIITSHYIKAPMLLRYPSIPSPPPRIRTFYARHHRIRCATSPLITHARLTLVPQGQPILSGSAALQAEEVYIIPGLPPSVHHAPLAQGFPSHPHPQPSILCTSPLRLLQLPLLPSMNLLRRLLWLWTESSLFRQRLPISHPNHRCLPPTLRQVLYAKASRQETIPINETGESSQTPSVTLLTHSHPDPSPVTVTPSTIPHPPSVSVEQQGDSSDTPRLITSELMSFYPLDRNERQDVTAPHAGLDITQISSTANQISQSIRHTAPAFQRREESTGVPPTTI
jgi:hypothetical protein